MWKFRILVADNDRDYLQICTESLQNAGYEVFTADSPGSAEKAMTNLHLHLAVLDGRMQNDRDKEDRSGLMLAENCAPGLPKILLTRYPGIDDAVKALRAKLIADYVNKKDGQEALLSSIQRILQERYSEMNRALEFQHSTSGELSLAGMVDCLEPGLYPSLFPERMSELDDLFRFLFLEGVERAALLRCIWHRDGMLVLEAQLRSADGEEQVLVICGRKDKHELYLENQKEHGHILNTGGLLLRDSVDGMHYAVAAWKVPGVNEMHDMLPFSVFYRQNGEKSIAPFVRSLVEDIFMPWSIHNASTEGLGELFTFYRQKTGFDGSRISAEQFLENMRLLCAQGSLACPVEMQYGPQGLDIKFPGSRELRRSQHFPDVRPFLFSHIPDVQQEVRFAHMPCELTLCGLLTPEDPLACLTDYSEICKAPVFHLAASFEASLRFEASSSDCLMHFMDMEILLLKAGHAGKRMRLEEMEGEAHKLAGVILDFREQCASLTTEVMRLYLYALLFNTAKGLIDFDPVDVHPRHEICMLLYRLMFSAMLAQKIVELSQSSQADVPQPRRVEIEADKSEISIDGRKVDLPPTETRLLMYLYKNANRVCTREEIYLNVFEHEAPRRGSQKSDKLTTSVNRLREEIEEDPRQPTIILSKHGVGYILEWKKTG